MKYPEQSLHDSKFTHETGVRTGNTSRLPEVHDPCFRDGSFLTDFLAVVCLGRAWMGRHSTRLDIPPQRISHPTQIVTSYSNFRSPKCPQNVVNDVTSPKCPQNVVNDDLFLIKESVSSERAEHFWYIRQAQHTHLFNVYATSI
ncbi:hypothetical protein KP79_PYT08942 [Mizuhopecten yessoensis]|uniref:Uncharacterized protein n=1 Tax=Mizuhopecten yessoensis TaxID=6573 RepID=A0A210PR71_MIZYE|nr:hypothetical protein KP79_PYT08942 [Mizuhopecten yessoensis]